MMLAEKYKPKTTGEFIGNKAALEELRKLIAGWKKGTALILTGLDGIGKTLAVELIAKEINSELVYYEGSYEMASQQSLFAKKKIIAVDEPNTAKGISDLIAKSSFPVIIITKDPYQPMYKTLRQKCKIIKLEKTSCAEVARMLEKICLVEKMPHNRDALLQIVLGNNGDIRASIIDMETLKNIDIEEIKSLGGRDRIENVFTTLKILFKTKEMDVAKQAIDNSEKSMDELYWWIENNLFKEFSGKELATAYEYLALADLFNSRVIKRQQQSLMKYVESVGLLGLTTVGNCRGYGFYAFPQRFFGKNKDKLALIEKISIKTHTTAKETESYFPLIKVLAEKNENACRETFGLDEDVELD